MTRSEVLKYLYDKYSKDILEARENLDTITLNKYVSRRINKWLKYWGYYYI